MQWFFNAYLQNITFFHGPYSTIVTRITRDRYRNGDGRQSPTQTYEARQSANISVAGTRHSECKAIQFCIKLGLLCHFGMVQNSQCKIYFFKYRVSPKKVYSSFLGKRWSKSLFKFTSFTLHNAPTLTKFHNYWSYTNHTTISPGANVGLAGIFFLKF